MNDPGKHPNSDNVLTNLTKAQMAEQGIPIVDRGKTKGEQERKELAEEAGQKDASWKAEPEPKSETQGEDYNYDNGMSQ